MGSMSRRTCCADPESRQRPWWPSARCRRRSRSAAARSPCSVAAWRAGGRARAGRARLPGDRLRAQGARRQGAQHPCAAPRPAAHAAARRARLPLLPRLLSPHPRHDGADPVRDQRERRLRQPGRVPRSRSFSRSGGRDDQNSVRLSPTPGTWPPRGLARSSSTSARRADDPPARARRIFVAPRARRSSPAATSAASASGRDVVVGLRAGREQVRGVPAVLAARAHPQLWSRPRRSIASTRTIGNMAEAFLYAVAGTGTDGGRDQVLNGPTNEVWIDPVGHLLRSKGVRFRPRLEGRRARRRRRTDHRRRVRDRDGRRTATIEADWFVCAMPVERARRSVIRDVLARRPAPRGASTSSVVDWMNGIQFFLRDAR